MEGKEFSGSKEVKLQAARVIERASRESSPETVNRMYYLACTAPVDKVPENLKDVVSLVADPETAFFDVEE